MASGEWREHRGREAWSMRVGDLFTGLVNRTPDGRWRAILNGAELGSFVDPGSAKETVDRQIWLSLTAAREGARRVRDRLGKG